MAEDTDSPDTLTPTPEGKHHPTMQLEGMELEELVALEATIAAARRALVERRKNEAVSDFVARIRALRVPLADVLPLLNRYQEPGTPTSPRKRPGGTGKRRVAPIKYRNPEDPTETWAGRGKPPKWLEREEAAGRDRKEFLVQRSGAPSLQSGIEDL